MSLNWIVEGLPRAYEARPSRAARELDRMARAVQPQPARNDDDHPAPSAVRNARRVYADVEDQTTSRHPAVTAAHIMTTPVLTLPRDASLREALVLMDVRTVRHVPVTDPSGALAGMVSDRDLPKLLIPAVPESPPSPEPKTSEPAPASPDGDRAAREARGEPRFQDLAAPLESVMSTRLLTALPDAPIRDVAQVMVDERVSCVPVVDSDGRLVGIITSTDILRAVITQSPLELWA